MTEDICVVGFRIFDDTNHKLALKKKLQIELYEI